MTMPAGSADARSERAIADDYRTIILNRVSWGAVIAGVVTALVAHLLLNMLGLGIGLGTLDPLGGDNPRFGSFSIGAAIWWTLSGIVASFLGGAVAGRLSGRPSASTGGWHGIVTWAATTLIVFYLLATSAAGILGGAFSVLGQVASGAGQAAAPAVARAADPFAGIELQVRESATPNDPAVLRDSVVANVRTALTSEGAAAPRARDQAVEALARAANISPDEARTRIAQWEQRYRQAADDAEREARQAAEAARRVVSRAGNLFGFIALVLGAVAAWFGGASNIPERELQKLRRRIRRRGKAKG